MQKIPNLYRKLFFSTLSISTFTFGGGYVIISLMKKKYVDEYHWITEEEMLDFTAISQATPGPVAVIGSLLVGFRMAGYPGALVAVIGTSLPPLVIMSVVSLFYSMLAGNPHVTAVLAGMQAGAAAVMVDVVLSMGRGITKQKRALPVAVMLASFAAVYFLHVNPILIILASAVLGGALALFNLKKSKGTGR
ncbi:MAG: chromate transporter [Acetanaerobacterium sp.]